MKKTLVSILLLLAMMLNVLALASCGGDGDGGATDTFLEPPKVEIPADGYDPEAKGEYNRISEEIFEKICLLGEEAKAWRK